MPLRITGMNSGLDTEAIITQLASARSVKVNSLKKAQIKQQWTHDALKDLNKKVYSFYTDTLSDMQYVGNYSKKKTTVSDESKASVVTSGSALNGMQEMAVHSVASSGYMTGGKISLADSSGTLSGSSKLSELSDGYSGDETVTVNVLKGTGSDTYGSLTLTKDTTLDDVVSQLKNMGLNASFDKNQGRLYIAASASGAASDFSFESNDVLDALGISAKYLDPDNAQYVGQGKAGGKIEGKDAEIELNGVIYTSNKNNFEINGLSITALEESEKDSEGNYKKFTLTTAQDTSGIKDSIKNFFKKYNELINEMSKLYNADAAKGYDPLLSEEKSELSDNEIEEWETKIKDSLLRKDSTLSEVMNGMTNALAQGFSVKTADGTTKTMYMSDFGINTLGYFKAEENERYAYHIDGDEDDTYTKSESDTLGYMIAQDPDAVASFFSQATKAMYSKLTDLMKSTEYSSAYTLYEDKQMKSEYSEYNTKIKNAEEKLNNYIDSWYEKFSRMETALGTLQSKQTSLGNLFGTGG